MRTWCLPATAPSCPSYVFNTKRPVASVMAADPWPGFGLPGVAFGWKLTTAFGYGLPLSFTTPDTWTYFGPWSQPAAAVNPRPATARARMRTSLMDASASGSGHRAGLAALDRAHARQDAHIDIGRKEPHRAVAQDEIHPAGVIAAEG